MNDCERSVVLGIAGPTCSGKSALTDAIQQYEPQDVLVLHQDDYVIGYDSEGGEVEEFVEGRRRDDCLMAKIH